jgi:hypothetical protein
MTAHHDLDRQLTAFLEEGPDALPDASFDAVRDRTEQTRQRVVLGPWRLPEMNKILTVGLGAAAVVVVLLVGAQFFGPASGGVGSDPTATPEPTPSATPWTGLNAGAFLITGDDGSFDGAPLDITVDIVAPGWTPYAEFDAVIKDDDGLDAPESVGVSLIAWAWPAETGFNVYGDPCHWSTTIPETPATTPEEIAAALAAQALTDPTAPVDVTVGGYAGKAITLQVPLSYHQQPDVPREEEFADCDQDESGTFAYYGLEGNEAHVTRNAQGPGQIDELWILDVEGFIVILDAAHGPAAPADVVDELRALAESATFEAR